MGFIKWMDENEKWLKIVFCIFYLDLTWMVYRIIKAFQANDTTKAIIWILIAVFGGWIFWIVDLIWMITKDAPFEF